jgi:hypothetical protein
MHLMVGGFDVGQITTVIGVHPSLRHVIAFTCGAVDYAVLVNNFQAPCKPSEATIKGSPTAMQDLKKYCQKTNKYFKKYVQSTNEAERGTLLNTWMSVAIVYLFQKGNLFTPEYRAYTDDAGPWQKLAAKALGVSSYCDYDFLSNTLLFV